MITSVLYTGGKFAAGQGYRRAAVPVVALLQDGMLNSTPQQGCIWTKVFLARKVFLASGQGQYMLKNGFFQPEWKITL